MRARIQLKISHTPLRRGVLQGLAIGLLLVPGHGVATLSRGAWESQDRARIQREAADSEAGRLLAGSLGRRDPQALLGDMRLLAWMDAPDWMRIEALTTLCQYFCLMEEWDSLAMRSARLEELGGRAFSCPLAAPVAGTWWVQVGAFSTKAAARDALAGKPPGRTLHEGGLWKSRLGPYPSRRKAEEAAAALVKAGRLGEHRLVEESGKP